MRRFLLFFVVLLTMTVTISAQQQHPFEVQRLSDWAPDYLTWTCSYHYYALPTFEDSSISRHLQQLKDLKEDDYIWIDKEKSVCLPFGACVIKSIDGVSTKGMSVEQFYNIVSKSNTHKLTWIYPIDWESPKEFKCTLFLRDTPFWVQVLDFKPDKIKLHGMNSAKKRKINTYGRLGVITDDEVDWSKYHTYDFAILGSDPLNDKKLLQVIAKNFNGFMKREAKNPDVFFTVTTNTNQSISTTYVPPVVQTIRNGSTTETRYNWITKKNDYVTKDNYRTVREEGYTKSNKTVSEFMEFVILDARKVRESKTNVPPIMYQATYKRDLVNPDFDPKEDYMAVASYIKYPFEDKINIGNWLPRLGELTPNGMFVSTYDKGKTYKVTKLIPGSEADKAGVKLNDRIVKVSVSGNNFVFTIKNYKDKHTITLPTHGQPLFDYKEHLSIRMSWINEF